MRFYVDLDNVLVNPVLSPDGQSIVRIDPRPEAGRFLSKLASKGEVWLLTASQGSHPARALATLGDAVRHLQGVIQAEDMLPIAAQIDVVREANVSAEERAQLWPLIQPLAPPGVMFDDFPVGSDMFLLKATAIGIGPEHWIQVERFDDVNPDRKGLLKAYHEYKRRFEPGTRLDGRCRLVTA